MHVCIHYKGLSLENFFPSLRTYSGKTFQTISFSTGKIFPDNKKKMLLAKALWICDFHRNQQFWTYFSPKGAGAAATYSKSFPRLCSSTSGFCWCLYLSRTPFPFFDSFLAPRFLQIYSGLLFSLFCVHTVLLWDLPWIGIRVSLVSESAVS